MGAVMKDDEGAHQEAAGQERELYGEPFAHLALDDSEDEVVIVQLDSEHGSGRHGMDDSFDFDGRFFQGAVCGGAFLACFVTLRRPA